LVGPSIRAATAGVIRNFVFFPRATATATFRATEPI